MQLPKWLSTDAHFGPETSKESKWLLLRTFPCFKIYSNACAPRLRSGPNWRSSQRCPNLLLAGLHGHFLAKRGRKNKKMEWGKGKWRQRKEGARNWPHKDGLDHVLPEMQLLTSDRWLATILHSAIIVSYISNAEGVSYYIMWFVSFLLYLCTEL